MRWQKIVLRASECLLTRREWFLRREEIRLYSSHICNSKRFFNDFFLNHNTIAFVHNCLSLVFIKPDFHKANFDHDNNQFWVKTKRLAGRMTAQPHNRFVFCVVVVAFALNGNQALRQLWPRQRPILSQNKAIRPGFHYTTNATTKTQKQSDYKVEQSSFTLIALFWLESGRCRGRNWLNGKREDDCSTL